MAVKFFSIIIITTILIIYYALGGSRFPDYLNYITISENGGWLFKEDEYFFVWISRAWLKFLPKYFDYVYTVDLLAAFVQLFYLIWIISGRTRNRCVAQFWITVFSGPLLLTTTLRGTISYLCSFMLVERSRSNRFIILLILLFGLAFHDSFIFVCIAYALSRVFYNLIGKTALISAYILAVLIVLFGFLVVQGVVPLILLLGIGIREIYFTDFAPPSAAKLGYAIFVAILVMPLISRINEKNHKDILFLVLLFLFSAILFALSSTPAIRMLMYVTGMSFIVGFHANAYPKILSNQIVMMFACVPVLLLMFWDLFRNVQI